MIHINKALLSTLLRMEYDVLGIQEVFFIETNKGCMRSTVQYIYTYMYIDVI